MPVVTRLNHTRLRVDDLERTVEFYKTILGLEEVRRHTSPRFNGFLSLIVKSS